MLELTLSICCFRYINHQIADLNELNRQIHRQLMHDGQNIPSTTMIDGKLVIRPCFVGARSNEQHARELVAAVIKADDQLLSVSANTLH